MLTETTAGLDTMWLVDPHRSTLTFRIAHVKVATVKGRFGTFAGALVADTRGALHATGTVNAATLDTGNALRDRRLRGPEFFDSHRHARIRFSSRQITRVGGGRLRITGDLTIRHITRRVTLHTSRRAATDDRLELTVTGGLSRADFDIDSIDLKAAGISDTVAIVARLSLTRAVRMSGQEPAH